MGKSTSFRWMAREIARTRGKDPESVRIPVLVSARKMEEYWDICDLLIEGIPNEIPTHQVFNEMWKNLHSFDSKQIDIMRSNSGPTTNEREEQTDEDEGPEGETNQEGYSFSMLDAKDSLETALGSLGVERFEWVGDDPDEVALDAFDMYMGYIKEGGKVALGT